MDIIKKIGLAVMSVVILIFLSFLAYENIKSFENTIIIKTQQHLLTIAKTEAAHIEDILRNIHSQLAILALNPIVKKRLNEGIRSSKVCDLEECPLEDSFKYSEDIVAALYRIDSKGIVQGRAPFKKSGEGSDYSEKPGVGYILNNYTKHFEDKDEQLGYISEVFTTNSGKRAISVCVPVFEKAKFIGVLRTLIYLDKINEIVIHIKAGKKGYAQIIDNDGFMIAHPKAKHLGKDILEERKKAFRDYDWVELENIVSRMARGEEGFGTYHSAWWLDEKPQIVKKLTAFAPINLGNELWSIGITMGYDEISTPIIAHDRNVLAAGGILFIIFIVGGSVFIKDQKEKTMLATKAQSAEEIREANEYLTNAIENSLDAIIISDNKGCISRANQSFFKMVGGEEQDTIGKHMAEFRPMEGAYESTTGESVHIDRVYLEKRVTTFEARFLEEGRVENYEGYFLRNDKKVVSVETNVAFIRNEKGEQIGAIGVIRDITERKRAEDEREKLIQELQNALSDVKKLSGLLPICASCKKVRDDGGYWTRIEEYIKDHSEADFSHSICPECMKRRYPQFKV